jgi:hypothetical protein
MIPIFNSPEVISAYLIGAALALHLAESISGTIEGTLFYLLATGQGNLVEQ